MQSALQLGHPTAAGAPARELLSCIAWPLPFSRHLPEIALGVLLAVAVAVIAFLAHSLTKSRSCGPGDEAFPGELGMLRAVLANLPDLIYVKDTKSRFLLANQETAEVTGVESGAQLVGKTDFDYFPADIAASFYQDEQRIIESGEPLISQNEHIQQADGRTRWILTTKVPFRNAEGKIVGIIGIGRNISALKETETELKRARENLHFKATHDYLTSLLNREAILDMLGRELSRSGREDGSTSVLLADLDHFKEVNDRYGHPIGDQVLRELARRFLAAVRTYDLVGRYGGEEFLVILGGCGGSEALARADQIRQAISADPIPTDCGSIHMTISVGVLPAREWGYPRPEDVLREVDVALYAAKAEGRDRCHLAMPREAESLLE